MISFHGVEFSDEAFQCCRCRLTDLQSRRLNENSRRDRTCRFISRNKFQNLAMLAEVAVDGSEDSVLIVPLGYVAGNPGHTEFIQHSRNILVFELHGAVCPPNLGHESSTMPGLDIWAPGRVG